MFWAIVPHDLGQLVGLLEYRVGEDRNDNRGFWIAREYQGRGYMTEAVVALQDYIFFELGVQRIFVCNAPSNLASARVKEKTGAQRYDEIELAHHEDSSPSHRWIVTRQAWAKLRGR